MPTNNDAGINTRVPVQTKETMELEQIEHGKRQKGRSIIQINEGVQRHIHPAEEQLIQYPSIPQSQQMELNKLSASNSQKRKNRILRWTKGHSPSHCK